MFARFSPMDLSRASRALMVAMLTGICQTSLLSYSSPYAFLGMASVNGPADGIRTISTEQ